MGKHETRVRRRAGGTARRMAAPAGVLLLAALAGCGAVSGIPVDETAGRIANTVCPKAYMCCTADQLSSNSAAGTDVPSCESATKQNYVNVLSAVQASVDQKRATYDSSKLDTCLATIQSSDCATLDTTNHIEGIKGCEAFTSPLVPIGGACSQDYECINGWCNVPAGSNNGQGTCTGFSGTGQSCAAGGGPSCGPNAVCDPLGTTDSSDDVCEPVSDIGGACTDDVQCTSLTCSSSGGSGMTCQAPATPPSMCFYQSGCSAAGGRPGPGTLVLFAVFVAVALARAGRTRRNR